MHSIREIAIGLLVDGLLSQLPEQVKRRPYMVKIFRAIEGKNRKLSSLNVSWKDKKHFNDSYTIAINGWQMAQNAVQQTVAVSLVIKFILEKEPWLIKYYKLNEKHLQKMYDAFNIDGMLFTSMRGARLGIEGIDTQITYYNQRKIQDGNMEEN